MYQVVGVCEYEMDEAGDARMYVPLTTFEGIYRPEGYLDRINLVCRRMMTAEENENLIGGVRDVLCRRKGIDVEEKSAILVDDPYETMLSALNVLDAIKLFVWLIGIATLIGGVVGISNIMFVGVKERMHEFGILRACGAGRGYIETLVLLESSLITILFGCVGMLAGVWLMKFLSSSVGHSINMFSNPSVEFLPLVGCTLVLVASGILAGLVPARKAASVKVIEALHDSN